MTSAARNPAMENATRIIGLRVGMAWLGAGPDPEVLRLAEEVGMGDRILLDPFGVASEITAYLDDIARNP